MHEETNNRDAVKDENPYMYKELQDENGQWTFNTSVAEQTNAWLQGYHSMCQEMLPARFDFFLDEMIRLKNIEVISKLERRGKNPREYDLWYVIQWRRGYAKLTIEIESTGYKSIKYVRIQINQIQREFRRTEKYDTRDKEQENRETRQERKT